MGYNMIPQANKVIFPNDQSTSCQRLVVETFGPQEYAIVSCRLGANQTECLTRNLVIMACYGHIFKGTCFFLYPGISAHFQIPSTPKWRYN